MIIVRKGNRSIRRLGDEVVRNWANWRRLIRGVARGHPGPMGGEALFSVQPDSEAMLRSEQQRFAFLAARPEKAARTRSGWRERSFSQRSRGQNLA